MLKLYTVVHPVAADNQWKAPEGWRWAIQTDDRYDRCSMHYEDPAADANCIIAGWQPSRQDAENEMSLVLAACRRTLLAYGGVAALPEIAQQVLADCPLGPEVVGELAMLG